MLIAQHDLSSNIDDLAFAFEHLKQLSRFGFLPLESLF